MKHENVFENNETFVDGFKDIKTDKIDNYLPIECESAENYEKDELFILWFNKFLNEEIEETDFKITG